MTPLVRKEVSAVPGNGTQGGDSGGSIPPSPPSGWGDFGGGGDFDSPTDSSSSSSSNGPDDDDGGGSESFNSNPGEAGGSEPGDPDGVAGGGNEPGEDSENLEEYKFDPAGSRYPPGLEAKSLVRGASSAGLLRHGLERGRTWKETRELQGSDEAPDPEEALMATALETEHGAETVANYIRYRRIAGGRVLGRGEGASCKLCRREMDKVLQSNDLEHLAFGAKVEDDGSTQLLPDPELSLLSPIGQKPINVEAFPMTYKDVLNTKYKVFWEWATGKEIGSDDTAGTFTRINRLSEGH